METWPSITFYSAFGVFVYYQRMYAQAYKGEGWPKLFLTALAFAGMLTGFFYLVDYGLTVGWWAPVIPLAMSALATIPAILIERLVGQSALGQLSVLAWPLCAYMMFVTLPG